MKIELERVLPAEIEARSFEIIDRELPHPIDVALAPIIKRVIHATADFDYADTLCFSEDVLRHAQDAICAGALFVTDTTMAQAGINKPALQRHGCDVRCFIADGDVAEAARRSGTTRAVQAVDKAADLKGRPIVFAVGNAPTALVRICELVSEGRLAPALVIGVPVGFVNVTQSKAHIMRAGVPYIVARGRKGGSNVAAAICNALLYLADAENRP
ncbi:MAG: precorrin-8X methylmutase [Clostridia bacterium]|nr:precorrin-8X methylmutase [Clostridia bacterium]